MCNKSLRVPDTNKGPCVLEQEHQLHRLKPRVAHKRPRFPRRKGQRPVVVEGHTRQRAAAGMVKCAPKLDASQSPNQCGSSESSPEPEYSSRANMYRKARSSRARNRHLRSKLGFLSFDSSSPSPVPTRRSRRAAAKPQVRP